MSTGLVGEGVTYNTTDGNHRNVSVFELSLETSAVGTDLSLILCGRVECLRVSRTDTGGIDVSFFLFFVGHGG